MERLKNLNLVCFGGGKFSKNEHEIIKNFGLEKNIKLFTNCDDSTLKHLYTNAKFLVLPSEIEGFGLPIIESMRNKCDVLASDIEVFKEIGQDKISYFENGNLDSLINELERKLNSEDQNFIYSALEYSKNFTWLTCAKKTFDIYSEMK